jgi:hypothetical protein
VNHSVRPGPRRAPASSGPPKGKQGPARLEGRRASWQRRVAYLRLAATADASHVARIATGVVTIGPVISIELERIDCA